MAWIVYTLSPLLGGYEKVLWEIPLDVIYALEHTHLWMQGRNTQGQAKIDEFYERLEQVKRKYNA